MSDLYARACARKRHYRSERRASDAAKESQTKFGVRMNAYECPIHKGRWVVGTTYACQGKQARRESQKEAA